MNPVLLPVPPLPASVPATTAAPTGHPAPEWHELRLFGRGRHPVNFDDGRERIVEL